MGQSLVITLTAAPCSNLAAEGRWEPGSMALDRFGVPADLVQQGARLAARPESVSAAAPTFPGITGPSFTASSAHKKSSPK
jgi:hypothetical protein